MKLNKFNNMFGYRIIKNVEIDNLKSELANAKETVLSQSNQIDELLYRVKELENTISNFNEMTNINVKNESVDEKPVKKVRRKSTRKKTKKEE